MSEIEQSLRAIQKRILIGRLLSHTVRFALFFSFAVVVCMAILLATGRSPWSPVLLIGWLCATAAASLVRTWLGRPSIEQTALFIDSLGNTKDRFTTGLDAPGAGSPLGQLALADCRAFIRRFDPAPFLPIRVPRSALALVAPAIAAGLLVWHYQLARLPDAATIATQQDIEEKANELERLTREIEAVAKKLDSPQLEKLADAMRAALDRLRAAAQQKGASVKDALRELSALEAMIAAMEQSQKQVPADRLNDLARQAEQQPPPESLDRDARSAAAAAKLSPEAQAELDRALAQARNTAESPDAAASEAMQRLAKLLREMARQARPQSQSQQAGSRALQAMRLALQDIKFGRASGKVRPADGRNRADSPMMIQGFTPPGNDGKNAMALLDLPSGQPGGEHDEGTSATTFGEKNERAGAEGAASQLTSVLGEGESLTDLVPAAGDTSKSTKRYRDLYKAVTAAPEETVEQENIPLASRFFIKRYFQSIRPAE